MLQPFYAMQCQPELDLIRIQLSGFFSVADVEAFAAAREFYHAQLRCGANQHLTLCDASGMRIQTQEVVGAFTRIVADPRYMSRRLALVVGSSLTRLQTQRVVSRSSVRLFRDPGEAESWLLTD